MGASVEELLTWAPEPLEERWHFEFISYARLRDLTGVSLPNDPGNADEVITYRDALFEGGNVRASPTLIVVLGEHFWEDRQDQLLRYFSLSFAHLDATLVHGPPGGGTTVSFGRFDRDAADQALRACDECPLELEITDHNGAEYYAWGGDLDQNPRLRFAPPALDGLGRGGRVYLTDTVAAHTFEHEPMRALLDAGTGQGPSLTDREDVRLAASALDEAGVYAGFISDIVYDVAYRDFDLAIMTDFGQGPSTDEPWYPGPGEPSLVPYRLVGAGAGLTEEGEITASFVLVHDSEGQASTNADQLRRRLAESSSALYDQPWSELLTDSEVTSNGRVVTATLVGPVSYTMVYSGDALLFFEE